MERPSVFVHLREQIRVLPYVTRTDRKGRRGHPPIPSGTVVYTIELLGKSYQFCYIRKTDAEFAVKNLKNSLNEEVYRFSFRSDPEFSTHIYKINGVKGEEPKIPLLMRESEQLRKLMEWK